MKALLCLSFVATILVVGCKKNENIEKDKPNLTGRWELRESIGMHPTTFYEPGNGRIMEFKNGTVGYYEGSVLDRSYQYRLEKYIGDCEYAQGRWAILFDSQDYFLDMVTLKNDKLSISTFPCYMDGGVSNYVRVK